MKNKTLFTAFFLFFLLLFSGFAAAVEKVYGDEAAVRGPDPLYAHIKKFLFEDHATAYFDKLSFEWVMLKKGDYVEFGSNQIQVKELSINSDDTVNFQIRVLRHTANGWVASNCGGGNVISFGANNTSAKCDYGIEIHNNWALPSNLYGFSPLILPNDKKAPYLFFKKDEDPDKGLIFRSVLRITLSDEDEFRPFFKDVVLPDHSIQFTLLDSQGKEKADPKDSVSGNWGSEVLHALDMNPAVGDKMKIEIKPGYETYFDSVNGTNETFFGPSDFKTDFSVRLYRKGRFRTLKKETVKLGDSFVWKPDAFKKGDEGEWLVEVVYNDAVVDEGGVEKFTFTISGSGSKLQAGTKATAPGSTLPDTAKGQPGSATGGVQGLQPPAKVYVKRNAVGMVEVSWTKVEGATGYEILNCPETISGNPNSVGISGCEKTPHPYSDDFSVGSPLYSITDKFAVKALREEEESQYSYPWASFDGTGEPGGFRPEVDLTHFVDLDKVRTHADITFYDEGGKKITAVLKGTAYELQGLEEKNQTLAVELDFGKSAKDEESSLWALEVTDRLKLLLGPVNVAPIQDDCFGYTVADTSDEERVEELEALVERIFRLPRETKRKMVTSVDNEIRIHSPDMASATWLGVILSMGNGPKQESGAGGLSKEGVPFDSFNSPELLLMEKDFSGETLLFNGPNHVGRLLMEEGFSEDEVNFIWYCCMGYFKESVLNRGNAYRALSGSYDNAGVGNHSSLPLEEALKVSLPFELVVDGTD